MNQAENLKISIDRLKGKQVINKSENIDNPDLDIRIKVLERAYDNILLSEVNRKSKLITNYIK